MAVSTAPKPGNMTEEEKQAKATSSPEVKTPVVEGEVSPEEEPKIYNQKQVDALVHAASSEAGRKVKTLETERDKYKSKLEAKESELADNAAEVEKLQAEFDDLAKDDPAKFDVAKELKAAREERRQLKTGLAEFEESRKTHGEEIKMAQDTLREIRIWEIAEEYKNADPMMLKNLCDTFEANSEEQIRKAADTIWEKQTGEEEKGPKAPKAYSGKSEGGSPYIKQSEINALWKEGRGDEVLKAQKDGRLKLNE